MKERVDLIKIFLGDGVVFVVVALGAGDGHAHPGHAGRGDAIHDVEVEIFFLDQAAFVTGHDIAMESRSNFLSGGRIGQHVTGDLFDGELVKRHAFIEGVDDPFAPEPHVSERVVVIAAGVTIPGQIKPGHGQTLAEMG